MLKDAVTIMINSSTFFEWAGEDSMILTFHMPSLARVRDYVKSIKSGSELLKKRRLEI